MLCATGSQASAQGAKYALLIGVGRYASPQIRTLDGPRFDVEAMQTTLVRDWHFEPARVTSLVDEQATRARILAALDRLIEQSRPGDTVVIFYSGHGTSRQDQKNLHYSLHPATGAIFPYDTSTTSEQSVIDSLIVGRRDLRPRFDRLDDGRQVLVILDSCYSRNATRAVALRRGTPKSQPLFGQLQGFASTGTEEAYPYRNIVTLTAASEAEEALDINRQLIAEGVQTIDGQPKGALTDALLHGLQGEANTNGDQVLTLEELFNFTRERVKQRFPHTPQLVLPAGYEAVAKAPLFGNRSVPTIAGRAISQVLRVRADQLSPALVTRLSAMPNVIVSATGEYDVRLSEVGGKVRLHHGSGDLLQEFARDEQSAIVNRIERERHARHLINLSYTRQTFNVRVDIPSKTGVLQSNGTKYTLVCDLDAPAAVLILNLDRDGMVTVLAPTSEGELSPRRRWEFNDITVEPPEGTEFVKVFAFRSAPSWLREWTKVPTMAADSKSIADLVARLSTITQDVAEARLKVVTVK